MSVRTFTATQPAVPRQRAYTGDKAKEPGSRAQRRFAERGIKSSGPIPRTIDTMRPLIRGGLLSAGIMLTWGVLSAVIR